VAGPAMASTANEKTVNKRRMIAPNPKLSVAG